MNIYNILYIYIIKIYSNVHDYTNNDLFNKFIKKDMYSLIIILQYVSCIVMVIVWSMSLLIYHNLFILVLSL